MKAIQRSCRDPTPSGVFLENHDSPCFLSRTKDMHLHMDIIVFSILAGWIPIIYQGQEQGLSDGNHPANHETVWTTGFSSKSELYTMIASVNQIRNYEDFALSDYLTSNTLAIYTDDHSIALRNGQLISLFSNAGANATNYNLTLTDHGYLANQAIAEVFVLQELGDMRAEVQPG
ncbi:MAG: hypothetical protein Q9184_003223 [Pyrenodesmia sp. 2 TL-2023]